MEIIKVNVKAKHKQLNILASICFRFNYKLVMNQEVEEESEQEFNEEQGTDEDADHYEEQLKEEQIYKL